MDRLDLYDVRPAGLDAFLSNYGWHFSKAMCDWAVSRMRDRNGARIQPYDKDKVDSILKANGIVLDNDVAYDATYVMNMARADYFGSSINDEMHLAKFVKDYLDDRDGYEGIAFSRFYADCVASGTPVLWERMM